MVFLKGIEKVEERKLSKLIDILLTLSLDDISKRVLGDPKHQAY